MYPDMPTTGLVDYSYGAYNPFGFAYLIGMITGPFMLVAFFVFLALVLYFFTGEKKRADDFMPKLMTVSLRAFAYGWMFVAAMVAFASTSSVLGLIFNSIGGKKMQSEMLLGGLGMIVVSAGVIFLMHKLLVSAQKMSNNYGTYSTKLFLFTALTTFSVAFIVSIYQFVGTFLAALATSKSVIDGNNVAMLITSMIFFSAVLYRIWKVLPSEK